LVESTASKQQMSEPVHRHMLVPGRLTGVGFDDLAPRPDARHLRGGIGSSHSPCAQRAGARFA
jgi:hypothetical protein